MNLKNEWLAIELSLNINNDWNFVSSQYFTEKYVDQGRFDVEDCFLLHLSEIISLKL